MAHFPAVTGGFYLTKRPGVISGLFIQKLLCKLPEMVMTRLSDFTHLGALLGKLRRLYCTHMYQGSRDGLDILIGKAPTPWLS